MGAVKTWKCDVCGHVHSGEAPPLNCPICGVEQELFSVLEVATPQPRPAADTWRCSICDHTEQGSEPPAACPVCGATRELFEPSRPTGATTTTADVGRVVVLGGGIAGLTAVEQARAMSRDVEILLVTKERQLPYYRLNLTRLLAGEVDAQSLEIHSAAWFRDQRIDFVRGEAVGIEREQSRLRLRDGRALAYDRLVLACGSHPFVPPIPGATREGVQVLRTVEDVDTLVERCGSGSRCAIIGGGLLGLETAGALLQRGANVTVLEGYGWLLPRQLPQPAGEMLSRHIANLGITVRSGVRVKELIGDERVHGVLLDDGEEIPADTVVISTGVRPNSYLARRADLEVASGVLVDDHMFTSDPAILAAGDVAEHRGVLYGIWPASYTQGAVAGINAVGGESEFKGMPRSNRIKVLDVDLYSIGTVTSGDASYRVCEEHEDTRYARLVCRDGKIVGAALYGDTSLSGRLKEAIESAAHLTELSDLTSRFPALTGSIG